MLGSKVNMQKIGGVLRWWRCQMAHLKDLYQKINSFFGRIIQTTREDLAEIGKELEMNKTVGTYIWTSQNGSLISKRIRVPKTLLTIRDSNEKIIVRLYRPKSYFALLYHKIKKLFKRK
jgi:hypothetical protein